MNSRTIKTSGFGKKRNHLINIEINYNQAAETIGENYAQNTGRSIPTKKG